MKIPGGELSPHMDPFPFGVAGVNKAVRCCEAVSVIAAGLCVLREL